MNGNQIEHLLSLIDRNVESSLQELRPQVAAYLRATLDRVAHEIWSKGYA
jgi:hypothetical protein